MTKMDDKIKLIVTIDKDQYEICKQALKQDTNAFITECEFAIAVGTPLDEWQTEAFKNGWKEGFGMGKQDLAHKVIKLFEKEKV